MARTLHLHIGRHKTGSTSIQHMLDMNKDDLFEQGLRIVTRTDYTQLNLLSRPVKKTDSNLFDLANTLLRDEILTGPRLRQVTPILSHKEKLILAAGMNDILLALPCKALLMSAEDFSFLRTPQEGQYISCMFKGFTLRPLLIDRDYKDWAQSYAKQTANLRKAFIDKVGTKHTVYDFGPNSWHKDLTGLKAVFPDADILKYETLLKRDGSVIPAFLNWLKIDPSGLSGLDSWENRT